MSQHVHGQVFFIVDTMPEFPGGETALKKFISEHIWPTWQHKVVVDPIHIIF